MWQLYQFPLCPFSRKVRLLLSEKGIGFELWRENPWEQRDAFVDMNPAARTPVVRHVERDITLVDSRSICEYFEETVDKNPMINGTAANRAEIRRLVALFDENLYGDVIAPLSQAAEIVNLIAPEHVEIATADPDVIARDVRHAGAIFLGRWAPEALGDYVTGSNHVLPTSGAARFASGLSVLDFMKRTSIQRIPERGFRALADAAETLAGSEGLPAHALSISIRRDGG